VKRSARSGFAWRVGLVGVASLTHPASGLKGGEHGVDARKGDGGCVQQDEGFAEVGAGKGFADGIAGFLDVGKQVIGQEMAVTDQQEMGFGEAAGLGAGEGNVGLPPFLAVIRIAGGDFVQASREGGEVAVKDFAEQGIEIDEVVAQGGGGDSQRGGEIGLGDGVPAMAGHQGLAGDDDAFVTLALAGSAEMRAALEGIGFGAKDSWVYVHGTACYIW